MSTAYYALREPITHIDIIHKDDEYDIIIVYLNNQKNFHSGVLTIPVSQTQYFIVDCFSVDADDSTCPIYTYYSSDGLVVQENVPLLHDDTQLVSGRGELITVGELRKLRKLRRNN